MTNIFVTPKTLVLSAAVAFGAIAFSSFSAQASITDNLAKCQSFSKGKVVSCCNTVITQQGKPLWFIENNMSCSSAVSCAGGGGRERGYYSKKRCYIQPTYWNNQGKDKQPEYNKREGNNQY
jgi:hypothetical protein